MPAVAVHHTGTSDASWDAGAQEKNIKADATQAVLGDVYAWKPTGDDADSKTNWKFPHHFVGSDGTPGDASTEGCSATVAALNGGRGGTTIPEGDRRGVYEHVIAHLKDSGVKEADLPELKSAPRRPAGARWSRSTDTPLEVLRERRSAMRGQRERRNQPLLVPGRSRQQLARGGYRAQFEFRANPDSATGPSFRFEGYAATFEQPFEMWDFWGDPYLEILAASACNRTLANGADVQFLINHDETKLPLARTASGTMQLSADSKGLHVFAPALSGRSPQVLELASAMDRGDVDEMSIGFITSGQSWSPDWMERRITEINLNRGDVSIVTWAANPNANGASLEALPVSEAAARQAGPRREQRTPTAPYSAKPGEDLECPQCHSMNDTSASYCDQCGTAVKSLTADASTDQDGTQRCPCGCWNAGDAKFCQGCGQNLASDLDADNGGRGNGATSASSSSWWDWSRRRLAERRDDGATGTGDGEPDFSGAPAYDEDAHGDASLTCPNGDCGLANAGDARYCDQCGEPLYDEGGLIQTGGSLDDVVSDSSGLIEEADMTLARARVRVLQLKA